MGELAGYKYRDVASKLRKLGFAFDRSAKGSHEIWRHKDGRKTTLPHHPGDMPEGTLRAVLKAARIEPDVFISA
jgi:predicted RNA binding protein YcfA (HicA-like mRNA interferase family)